MAIGDNNDPQGMARHNGKRYQLFNKAVQRRFKCESIIVQLDFYHKDNDVFSASVVFPYEHDGDYVSISGFAVRAYESEAS